MSLETVCSDCDAPGAGTDLLDLTTASTVETAASSVSEDPPLSPLSEKSSASATGTPANSKGDSHPSLFVTPTKDGCFIPVSTYEQLGLSPTMMRSYSDAEKKMLEDKIEEQHWYPRDTNETSEQQRACIIYLYGMCFFDKMKLNERLQVIEECISPSKGNLKRLKAFAVADANDRIMHNDSDFDLFFAFQKSFKMLMSSDVNDGDEYSKRRKPSCKKIFGRNKKKQKKTNLNAFLGDLYLPLQTSQNCYIVGVGAWLTQQCRRCNSDLLPVDIAQMARRNVLVNDQALLDRVLGNHGGAAYTLARAVVGHRVFINHDFGIEKHKGSLGQRILKDLRLFGPALVTNFHLSNSFKDIIRSGEPEIRTGYHLFNGDSLDTEPRWVDNFLGTKKEEQLDKKLRMTEYAKWSDLRLIQATTDAAKKKIFARVPSVAPSTRVSHKTMDVGAPKTKQNHAPREENLHCMLLVGAIQWTDDKFFVLLNWHRPMPLLVVSENYFHAAKGKMFFMENGLDKEINGVSHKVSIVSETYFPDVEDPRAAVASEIEHNACLEALEMMDE